MSTIRDIENKAVEALLGACHPLDRIIGAELQEALAKRERIRAAAPELLAALIGCVEHMEHSTPHGRAAYESARAAIAKAEGRA